MRISPSVLEGHVNAPPSKSYTHRAIILSSLCSGKSMIENPLASGDTLATIEACEAIGAEIESKASSFFVDGPKELETPSDVINVGNSGTTMRIMTAVSSIVNQGYVVLTGDESIRNRPMQPLLDALQRLGVECWSARMKGFPPIVVKGGTLRGGDTEICGNVSSQFLSAILITAPRSRYQTTLKVQGRQVSKPYVDATLRMIKTFGGKVVRDTNSTYQIPPNQSYCPAKFRVPGDFSSASFLMAGAALTGGKITVKGLDFLLPQADKDILDILGRMNVSVKVDEHNGLVKVKRDGSLSGGEFDLTNSPDLLPVVSILAAKAKNKVTIRGVEHARFKESDRVAVLANELRKFGVRVRELKDGLTISPSNSLKSCTVNTHRDHRIFMAFALLGMVTSGGCLIDGAEHAQISYPSFIQNIQEIGGRIEVVMN
jgi:3-phosphoshikimate 1-carboxyvinyltransferase